MTLIRVCQARTEFALLRHVSLSKPAHMSYPIAVQIMTSASLVIGSTALCLLSCARGVSGERQPGLDNDAAINEEFDGNPSVIDAAQAIVDASPTDPDGAIDASLPPPPPSQIGKLLISEVVLAPTDGEFVEIANPTMETIALDRYYITDSQRYAVLPSGAPTLDPSDFIARFPAGASIAPGAVATIAVGTASAFQTTYGMAPTFAITGGNMRIVTQIGVAGLTNAGEMVALFYWDGQTDNVKDSDLINVGVPTSDNRIPNKSNVAVDGPDAGIVGTLYATDRMTMGMPSAAPANALSMKRAKSDAGYQTANGNGIGGDDETSEMIAQSWSALFSAPTPNTIPFAL
jgi:hypothetical protein